MAMTVRARYLGGVLQLFEPLPLAEGVTIEVTIDKVETGGQGGQSPTPEEEDYARRLRAAKSLEEMYAVMETAPSSPEDPYDLIQRMNESRRLTGFRLPDSEAAGEAPR
jgi:hypothetical protein